MIRTLLLGTMVAALALAQAPQRPRRPAPEDMPAQWQSMFNGKDLTGWVKVGNEKWEVEEGGIIHGQGITKEYGYLRTEQKYKDFEMSLRWKAEADGNSGVFFHSDFKPGTADVSQGLQFEIDRVLNRHTGGIYGDGRNWIAWPAADYETVLKPDDWNDMYMKVVNNRYICRLNGVTVLDFTDPSPRSFDGYISLQLHSGGLGNMKFKELYIRDLTKR